MPFLSRKGILAIAAVTDIALNAEKHVLAAKVGGAAAPLPAAFGARAPGVGAGRNTQSSQSGQITAEDILRTARIVAPGTEEPVPDLPLLKEVVVPALAEAEQACSDSFSRISVADLTRSTKTRRKSAA
jgi:hypothetical protein